MANAAAKKAAAAKEATANVYQPILIGSNIVYILLLVGWNNHPNSSTDDNHHPSTLLLQSHHQQWTVWKILAILITWGLQAFSYMGILDRAKNAKASSSASSSSASSSKGTKNKKDLVGGAHLDLLGLTMAIQYGSVLHSPKWFYLLLIVPIWGGWMFYTTFLGGGRGKNKGGPATAAGTMDEQSSSETSEALKDKREKRAQKRRQKWG